MDPATDFRGAGIMGLENLLAITNPNGRYYSETIEIFKDSLNNNHWYLFAVTGLNITNMLLNEFDSHRFDSVILANI